MAMYPKLQVGGYLVTDDYDLLPFVRAINQFRAKYKITEKMIFPKVPVLKGKVWGPKQGMYWRVERQVHIPLPDVATTFPHARGLILQS